MEETGKKNKSLHYKANIAFLRSGVFMVLAVFTLLPHSLSENPNFLGYGSLCSFVPYSTLCLLVFAAVFYFYAKSLYCKNRPF